MIISAEEIMKRVPEGERRAALVRRRRAKAGPVEEHGTVRGFNRHRRAKTDPCKPCRYAAAVRDRELREAKS